MLPNAWDRASARLLSGLDGVEAIATTSAGIAAAHGLPDGELMSRDAMLAAAARIAAATPLPVTADLESGYGDAAGTVRAAMAAGLAGANLEDGDPHGPGLLPLDHQRAQITAAREAAADSFVINARTDTYWLQGGGLAATIERVRAYRDAGADCVFVPGLTDEKEITELVAALDGTPLNLLAAPGLPTPHRLGELGVRRLTVGSALYRLALAAARDAMTALLHDDPGPLTPATALPYADLARLLT